MTLLPLALLWEPPAADGASDLGTWTPFWCFPACSSGLEQGYGHPGARCEVRDLSRLLLGASDVVVAVVVVILEGAHALLTRQARFGECDKADRKGGDEAAPLQQAAAGEGGPNVPCREQGGAGDHRQ